MNEHKMEQRMTNSGQQSDAALHEQQEWLRVTLSSIGDAVITTDNNGDVTFLNPVAQTLTGWTQADAAGKPLDAVFKIINEATRHTVENPVTKALREGVAVGLANHTLLIGKNGTEWPIDDSAAPIRNAAGEVAGVVLVFRDVTERKRQERVVKDALAYADNILATLREPFLVLDQNLRVVTANHSFYENFHVAADETQGRFVYDLGNRQWDIPKLRTLLEEVLPQNHALQDFEVEHDFSAIGQKSMLLNARRILRPGNHSELILLAIEDVTERRTIDKISGMLAAIVQSSGDAIISRTLDGVITSWNNSAEKMFGHARAEAVGQNISLIIPTDRRSEESDVVARILHGDQVDCYETERITKDGQRIDISLSASPIKDASGQIIGISKLLHDITEQRETQRLLEVSETRFRRLFEAAHDGILLLDAASHKITHVNPFLMNLLGYPSEHFLGKELWEIGFLSDKQASQSAMQQLSDEGSIRYESLPLEDHQGRTRPVELIANVYEEDHHPVIQCNVRDIAERSRLEMMLRGQASELSDLHRRKDEFLAMLSHELRSPLAPIANAVQLLGLQRGSENRIQQQARGIIERQLGQLQHLVDDLLEVSRITTGRVQLRREPAIVSDIVEGAVETVRPLLEQRRHELTVTLPPEPIWLHADVARLEQVLVNLLTNAAKFTDIGGHVWLTVNVEGQQKSGEWRVASGEKEKADSDIFATPPLTTHHSPSATQDLRHDRATLSGTQGVAIGDEFGRTVLSSNEELSQGGTIRPNQSDSQSSSISAGQHRRGAGTPAHEGISESSEHRAGITHGSGNALAPQSTGWLAQSNNIGPAPEDVGRNQSDALRSSARAGSEALSLATHHSPLATPWVVIRVRDTGVGIAPALLPRIFDLFTQSERSLDRSQGGLGIGLALVQRLTELHEGKVEAHSIVGEGSEFIVRLPMESDEGRVASGESGTPSSLTTHHSPLATPLRVLVVDDNVDTVLSFSMLLRAAGHDVQTAHDGPSAVQAALDYQPDVVLLDIGLPGLNGYEVAKRIRQQPTLKNVVLVAVTGYGQETDRKTSLDAGFNHHLVKPARLAQLQQILATVAVPANGGR